MWDRGNINLSAARGSVAGYAPGVPANAIADDQPWCRRRAGLPEGLHETVEYHLAPRFVERDRELVAVHRFDRAGAELRVQDTAPGL